MSTKIAVKIINEAAMTPFNFEFNYSSSNGLEKKSSFKGHFLPLGPGVTKESPLEYLPSVDTNTSIVVSCFSDNKCVAKADCRATSFGDRGFVVVTLQTATGRNCKLNIVDRLLNISHQYQSFPEMEKIVVLFDQFSRSVERRELHSSKADFNRGSSPKVTDKHFDELPEESFTVPHSSLKLLIDFIKQSRVSEKARDFVERIDDSGQALLESRLSLPDFGSEIPNMGARLSLLEKHEAFENVIKLVKPYTIQSQDDESDVKKNAEALTQGLEQLILSSEVIVKGEDEDFVEKTGWEKAKNFVSSLFS